MDISEAQEIVAREKTRWFSFSTELSDDELLRRRERLFSGLTMVLAVAVLPTWFFDGSLGALGLFVIITGEIVTARYCSRLANRCRDVREVLSRQSHESSVARGC